MVPTTLLLASLAFPQGTDTLSSTAAANRELVIGVDAFRYGVLYWDAMPQPDQEIRATVGTKLVFKYGTDHDVVLVSSENAWLNCESDEYEELASTTEGGGAAGEPVNLHAVVVTAVGEYYFTCSQPGHCQAGQKVKVIVTLGSPPPPRPPQVPPMPPRLFPPHRPPAAPPLRCKDNPDYEEQETDCNFWKEKDCLEAIDIYGMPPAFDIYKLLLNCPAACLDGSPDCRPPPPPPSPPLMPAPPEAPPSPPSPPRGLCFDDASYNDGGWTCKDWAGRECRKLAQAVGVDVEWLVVSCPNACADATPMCFHASPSSPQTPGPPPPSPPPDLGWCLGYSFEQSVASSVVSVLLCALAVLLAGAGFRFVRPRPGAPRFPAKRRRYTGVATWLLLITIPSFSWMVAVGPYVACYLSPAVLVIGILLWLLVSFTMAVASFSDPGVIPRNIDGPDPDEMVRRTKLVNGVEFELKYCSTCRVVRPPRSSHDRKTDRCVLKFDHYCVFIGNTVGRSNYLWFLCFIGLTSFGALCFVGFSLFHVLHLAGRLEREVGHDAGVAMGKAVGQAVFSVVIGIYFAVMGTLVTLLFLLHCYLVSTAQTTYEFMRGAWKKRHNPFDRGLRANWMAVALDAAMNRSQCDGNPTIETTTSLPRAGEYVGPKISSPLEGRAGEGLPASCPIAEDTPPIAAAVGRLPSAEFQLHIGDQVVSTTLTEKMLKKSLHKALIDPFLKQYKGKMKIAKVMIEGEQADVTKPAAAFVRHKDRAVSMHLVRLGDQVS